ncbi:GGT1-like protein [Mya arenaria]|uniref:GGT1-like protein n=1 Tax=Mya arenaria TaxID=6604 RepID=A0ABY7E2F0_MYAAR|nr:glutathione hydrolase 1 proenzyme-like [Mya arenaria]WAR01346.1 GGT1-like protein [Mya arenaria]
MGEKISKTRAWVIVTILMVACIVALALGLALGLRDDEKEYVYVPMECETDAMPSSSRLKKDSPLYVRPSDTKEGNYRFGTVAADSRMCSSMGSEMMIRHGGSAVDAAITGILCSGVFNFQSCGIGGGFFMTFYRREDQKRFAVMSREMAPGAASEDMYVDGKASSTEGAMAIGIPGEIKGLYEAWTRGGRLPWETLFRPIIQLCEDGYPVGPLLAKDIKNNERFYPTYSSLRALVTNANGELLKEGDTIRLPKLAETMRKISQDPFTFYNGTLAKDIVKDIQDEGGIITEQDLQQYFSAVKSPIELQMSGGYTAIAPPPPSSGGVLILILNILNGYKLTSENFMDNEGATETLHRVIESFKHGFSLRSNLGDSDMEDSTFKANVQELIANMTSPDFAAAKRAKITRNTHETSYYEPAFDFAIPDAGTSHLSVLGPNGDAVSITSTVNLYFGSKVVGNRTGIVFNNQMDDFSTPNTTNYFNVPASPANFIKPYKRPMSSISPTIVLNENGDVVLVTGASGGTRILTSTALSVIETMWLGLGMKEAIEYPRFHHQLLPLELRIEEDMPQAIMNGLRERGHKFELNTNLGSAVQAILRRPSSNGVYDSKDIYAYSDPVKYGLPDGA